MYTVKFWKDALERIVSTTAAGLVATFGGINLFDLDWEQAAGITGSLALITLLKVLAVRPLGETDSASAIDTRN
ncbi:holin [Gordonia phage Archimedes]|uniref:Holin n=1 Tax=Gordonia phage Archimedes TaxID=2759389 RepID=A0A7L7SHY9_9CAUD|nr:holin [Gordonia phage Archimedes]QOC55720.1 holin [Gordonia phage Archimedes]